MTRHRDRAPGPPVRPLVDDLPARGPRPRRPPGAAPRPLLDAVLRLHFAQEDGGYFSLIDDDT
ncbi:MAG: hypothetical protein U0W40_06540 [Acidimicrobiia bacterium]